MAKIWYTILYKFIYFNLLYMESMEGNNRTGWEKDRASKAGIETGHSLNIENEFGVMEKPRTGFARGTANIDVSKLPKIPTPPKRTPLFGPPPAPIEGGKVFTYGSEPVIKPSSENILKASKILIPKPKTGVKLDAFSKDGKKLGEKMSGLIVAKEIDNKKEKQQNRFKNTESVYIDDTLLKTDAELVEDNARIAKAQEGVFQGVEVVDERRELRGILAERAKELEEEKLGKSEQQLFTIEKFEADIKKSKQTAEDEAFKIGLRDKILSEESREPAVLEKIRLETEMKKAKLRYILAYKDLYPKFANELEDDISKFPPPKFTFLSKDKQNLVKLHRAALDAEEEWLHAQGVGFVNKNVKESKVKFHSESLGEPGDVPVDSKKLKKAEEKNLLASAKEERRNADTDNYLDIQAVLDPDFLFMKEKPSLAAVKAKAELAKSVYAKAYREMFPEQFPKDKMVTNDFISLLAPPKVGMFSFNKDKKRLLMNLYEIVQQAVSLENKFSKSK